MAIITDWDRWRDSFWGALLAFVVCSCIAIFVTTANVRAINMDARRFGIHEPNLVAVSSARRGVRYTVDTNSDTCYIMYSNVLGTTMAPVDCARIGIDPISVRTSPEDR